MTITHSSVFLRPQNAPTAPEWARAVNPPSTRRPTHLKRLLRGMVATTFLILSHVKLASAQQTSKAFEKWASKQALPIRSVEAEGDMNDLVALKPVVGAARVVALGEPTHGAHEPLVFRNRLIRFLVEEMGFGAVALETGFTEARAIDRFVTGGPGEAKSIVQEAMSWGFGQFPENVELIQWLRDYNADPKHVRKIRFYGFDLSGAQDGAFPKARRAVDFALDFLARNDAAEADKIRQRLDVYLKRFSTEDYPSLSTSEREKLTAGIAEVAAVLDEKRTTLVATSSDDELQWARQSIVVAQQLNRMFELSPPPSPSPGIPPDAYRAATARDASMADNVRWALEREGPNGRLLVFAHNNHVMDAALEGGVWSAFRQPPSTMGRFLRPALGRDLLILGTAAGGSAGGFAPIAVDPTSLDAALTKVGVPQFILDLRPAQDHRQILNWLSERRILHANHGTHVIVAPASAFDAMFFIDRITPARARKQ